MFAFEHPFAEMGQWTVPVLIVNLSIARFLNIVIVSYLVNRTRTNALITCKFQFAMWVAGLRGAMAYALALKSSIDFPKMGPIMLITTIIYALISILGVGSAMYSILTKLDVVRK